MDSSLPPSTEPNITALNLYSRCLATKLFFQSPGSSRARYFITNPDPNKHNPTWKPVFFRGDNPKYSPGTIAVARARRGGMWLSIRVWLGDGVHEVLENKRRAKAKKSTASRDKWRRRLWLKPKPPKWCLEDEKDVCGKVVLVRMKRVGMSRSVEFEVDGEVYRWSGTRIFGGRVKGWSHNLKLIRESDHALIAAFKKKSRWVTYTRSEKLGCPPNKKRNLIGQLQIYDEAAYVTATSLCTTSGKNGAQVPNFTAQLDDITSGKKGEKDEKDVNPKGTHSGNLLEEAIVFTFWIATEAEHQLRYKILILLEEIGENLGG